MERGFNRWLAASPGNAAAFETVSTAWEATAALPRGPFPSLTRWQRAGFRQGFMRAAAAVVAVSLVAAIGVFFYLRTAGVATAVGEQRTLTLQDGTRVYLNTDTRVVVHFDSNERHVELKSGEALFEVARKGPEWPFVVNARGARIQALGTSFLVRSEPEKVTVTLMEGKVAVTRESADPNEPHVLNSGERLTVADHRPPRIDQPSLDKVAAWRTGHVDFDQVPLADAAAEMNRYSELKVFVDQPDAAAISVTGIFRAGDTESFANAVAASYSLQVRRDAKKIVLTGTPRRPAPSPPSNAN
jgi:transmembrane sensor